MKQIISIIIFLFFTIGNYCQHYEYIPFPDSNALWSEYFTPALSENQPATYFTYALFNEDTVINNLVYNKLFLINGFSLDYENKEYIGGIREKDKTIYYLGKPIFPKTKSTETSEFILFNFGINVGDTVYEGRDYIPQTGKIVEKIDTIEIYGKIRRAIYFKGYNFHYWIEGIGSTRGLLYFNDYFTSGENNKLVCFQHKDELLFHNDLFENCYEPLNSIINNEGNFIKFHTDISSNSLLISSDILLESIEILSINGHILYSKKCRDYNQEFCNINLLPGIYIIRVTFYNGRILHEKINL